METVESNPSDGSKLIRKSQEQRKQAVRIFTTPNCPYIDAIRNYSNLNPETLALSMTAPS